MHTSKVLDKETDRETKKRKQLKSKVTTDKATNQKAVEITSTALIKALIVTVHCKIINHMEEAFAGTIINLSEYQQKMR
ncbi:MAG: hypothetical protein GX783_09240 [Clostridiales bacterium]|nr:hypothetical protein [Clostridiales bacterium]